MERKEPAIKFGIVKEFENNFMVRRYTQMLEEEMDLFLRENPRIHRELLLEIEYNSLFDRPGPPAPEYLKKRGWKPSKELDEMYDQLPKPKEKRDES